MIDFKLGLLAHLPIGYALHKVMVNDQGDVVDYQFIDVNAMFEKFTGLKKDDIMNKNVTDVIPSIKDDPFDWIGFYGDVAINQKSKEFIQYSIPLERSYKVTAYAPEKGYFITFFSDESMEIERENVLHNIIKKAPVPIMIHAEDGKVIHISDEWTKLSGYSHKDIPDTYSWTQKAYGFKQKEVQDFIENLYKDKLSQHDGEFHVKTKSNETLTWDFYSTYLGKLYDHRKIAMSVALDVTKRNELHNQLNQTKQLLNSSLNSTMKIIIISLDTSYRYLFFNDRHKLEMKNAYGTVIELGDCIFDHMSSKDDIKRIKADYDKALSGISHITLEQFGDKIVRVYETHFNPIKDVNDHVIGVSVFSEDVTERITVERQLKKSQRLYKEMVNTLTEGIVRHHPNTAISAVNSQAVSLLGIPAEDLIGKKVEDKDFMFVNTEGGLLSVEHYPVMIVKQSKQALRDYIIGLNTPYKDRIVWVSVNGVPLFDESNQLEEIVISFLDVTHEKEMKEKLIYSAYNDYLTKLYNRRYYQKQLIDIDCQENLPISLIMADINGLKLINDAFGHDAGDALLVEAAQVLKTHVNKHHLIARIGGDEFVIVCSKTTEKETNEMIAKIKEAAAKIKINSIPLSISFGYSTKKVMSKSIHDVYQNAEDMMYREKLLQVPSMRSNAIDAILQTLYEKDSRSEEHSRIVSDISAKLAKALNLNMHDVSEIKTAGLLHDIGKIIISSDILKKEGKLTPAEYDLMKTHSEIGFRILNSSKTFRGISEIILNHHEKWDGSGYPRGLKGPNIPLKARIISVADAYDAMTSLRTYRDVLKPEDALAEIKACAGTQFDPSVVDAFAGHFKDIVGQ